MNIEDFFNNLRIEHGDFGTTDTKRLVTGITNTITRELCAMNETKRPIHCTDSKRNIMYVNQKNIGWTKDVDNTTVVDGIKQVKSQMMDEAIFDWETGRISKDDYVLALNTASTDINGLPIKKIIDCVGKISYKG